MRAGLPVSVRGRDGQPLLLVGPAGDRAWPRTTIVNEGVDVVIGGGVESITMMQRDSAARTRG